MRSMRPPIFLFSPIPCANYTKYSGTKSSSHQRLIHISRYMDWRQNLSYPTTQTPPLGSGSRNFILPHIIIYTIRRWVFARTERQAKRGAARVHRQGGAPLRAAARHQLRQGRELPVMLQPLLAPGPAPLQGHRPVQKQRHIRLQEFLRPRRPDRNDQARRNRALAHQSPRKSSISCFIL